MKKSRIFGYALTLAATLVVGSAMGQTTLTPTDQHANFVEIKTGTSEDVSYQTVGANLYFYVQPDVAYHPGWLSTAADKFKLTLGFTWVWSSTSADVKFNGATNSESTPEKNYVQIQSAKAGVYPISVKVTASDPGPFKGLCDGDATPFSLVVVPQPTVTAVAGGYDQSHGCTAAVKHDVTATIKANGTINLEYTIGVYKAVPNASGVLEKGAIIGSLKTLTLKNTDLGSTWEKYNVTNGEEKILTNYVANTTAGTKLTATSAVDPTDITKAQSTMEFVYTGDFKVPTDETAVIYEISFTKINDLVSRKSQHSATDAVFAGPYTMNSITDKSVQIVALAKPKTGPVFHVSNNIAK